MAKKKYKVIVVGLPKTGTSTLAVMLRMLGYRVTGPNGEYKTGDNDFLYQKFSDYDGFQDYPWCFEWRHFLDDERVKFIILKREMESWWQSFYESYGTKNGYYLSRPFFKLNKSIENKQQFLEYYETHYKTVGNYASTYPKRFLNINIQTFEWKELCDFLEEEVPKNLMGQPVKKPHVNKEKSKIISKKSYKVTNKVKNNIIKVLGKDRWNRIIIFLRKNGMV